VYPSAKIVFPSENQDLKGQTKMKKQINPTIKGHLLRSALIVVSLLAVCVIPFAIAQQTHLGKPDEPYGSRLPLRVVKPTDCIVLNEGFDDIRNLPGWVLINHSQPLGASDWFQGNDEVFSAFDGASTAYIAANYNNGGDLATISNWLLTREVGLQDGATLTFYTRTVEGSQFPDRLQVRMSTNGASTNIGTTAFDVGDFTNLLLDINPTYTIGGYPEAWTQFTVIISGAPPGTTGRLAFRYFVEDAGPQGVNSNYIGIDRAVYTGPCFLPRANPTPRPRPTPAPRP
jgi:hypothetical protein